nr:NifT/FixU family protein [Rhizobium grahamii]
MIRRTSAGLSAYVPKKDLEEPTLRLMTCGAEKHPCSWIDENMRFKGLHLNLQFLHQQKTTHALLELGSAPTVIDPRILRSDQSGTSRPQSRPSVLANRLQRCPCCTRPMDSPRQIRNL